MAVGLGFSGFCGAAGGGLIHDISGIGGGLLQGGRAVVVHQLEMCWLQLSLSAAMSVHVFATPLIGSQSGITRFMAWAYVFLYVICGRPAFLGC